MTRITKADLEAKIEAQEALIKALEKSWAAKTYALFMEMGTGKSKVLVDNIAMLYDRGAIDTLDIVFAEMQKATIKSLEA